MTKKVWLIQLALSLLCLLLVLVLETFTDIDMWLQRRWYDYSAHEWLISRAEFAETRWFFYGGAKKMLSILAGVCGALLLLGLIRQKFAGLVRPSILILLALALIPTIANSAKRITDAHCPVDLVQFEGENSYQRVLLCRPADSQEPRGYCFPAGHASGGFAMMILFFCFPKRRWLGLGAGLGLGWIMGLYQMLRGEHFLSHTLATMTLAWLVILLILPVAGKLCAWRDLYRRRRAT